MSSQRLDWTRDELILALDLYFRCPAALGNDRHPEVLALSAILQSLPIYPLHSRKSNFRNASSVYMKLMNFRKYDEKRIGGGLSRGGRLEKVVWDEYSQDSQLLGIVATAICDNAGQLAPVPHLDELRVQEVAEGGILYRVHRQRERDSKIVLAKKKSVLAKEKALRCEVCAFDFAETYGLLGSEFAECHHTKPIATMQPGDTTKLAELSIVCANCHRMLHRRAALLSIEGLRKILSDESNAHRVRASFRPRER
jgi:5-methylcytosine-specific restriction protein A